MKCKICGHPSPVKFTRFAFSCEFVCYECFMWAKWIVMGWWKQDV